LHRFLLSSLQSEFRRFGIPRRGDEGEYAYAVQRDIARHAASLASGEEPSKFSEIHYDAKSTFGNVPKSVETLKKFILIINEILSRFALAKS